MSSVFHPLPRLTDEVSRALLQYMAWAENASPEDIERVRKDLVLLFRDALFLIGNYEETNEIRQYFKDRKMKSLLYEPGPYSA